MPAVRHSIQFLILFCLVLFVAPGDAAEDPKEEDTYAISLVQTAEIDKEIIEVEGKKVLTESYKIQKGDHLWQIFRERGLLKKRDLPELLALLKNLNSSLADLDLVLPGQEIIIPLTIAPIEGAFTPRGKPPEQPVPLETLKDLKLENYTVMPGDSLIKIVNNRYDIPTRTLHNEYLDLIKKLNPSVTDLNRIYPDQKIRLPVYSPQIVRMPVEEAAPPTEPFAADRDEASRKASEALGHKIGEIFSEIGEEWADTGHHFIPLKAGGQVNLSAASFPVLNLSHGNRVIVDLHGELPRKMARVIQSDWNHYRVVHLEKAESLKSALDKILSLCGYAEILRAGEPLELGGDIPVRITADWIIKAAAASVDEKGPIYAVIVTDETTPGIPRTIRRFLEGLGIRTIEYPPNSAPDTGTGQPAETLPAGQGLPDLIETLLNLTGQTYAKTVEIPVYQGKEKDFNLMVKADFLLHRQGRDAIIDFSGLGPDIVSLLQEHRFSVLTLSSEKDPVSVAADILTFLGVAFGTEPLNLPVLEREETPNIHVTISGITFRDHRGQTVLATPLSLPAEITEFLSERGYKVLGLNFS